MWWELENRVFKTRFIIQKNFKNLPSLKRNLTSPTRSDHRERVRSKRGRPDKRERKSQIREGEKEIARARPGRATWVAWPGARVTQVARPTQPRSRQPRSRDLGLVQPGAHAAQAAELAQPRPRDLGRANVGLFLLLRLFFFFSFWLWFLFLLVLLFCYIWALNRVFKTRFSSGRHVKNDATSDVIRPWKSSLKDSIYGSKSTLLNSNCY